MTHLWFHGIHNTLMNINMNYTNRVDVAIGSNVEISTYYDCLTTVNRYMHQCWHIVNALPLLSHMRNVNFKYLYRQNQYSKSWDSKCLALIAQIVIAFGMIRWIRRLGSKKKLTLKKNMRSCVKNECCCPRTVNISNLTYKKSISPDVPKYHFIKWVWKLNL